jgi:hypothetical protein
MNNICGSDYREYCIDLSWGKWVGFLSDRRAGGGLLVEFVGDFGKTSKIGRYLFTRIFYTEESYNKVFFYKKFFYKEFNFRRLFHKLKLIEYPLWC